ncbi:MAG: M20/M25/M40 family metallo-hydrolase [Parvularculaceae bacterium]
MKRLNAALAALFALATTANAEETKRPILSDAETESISLFREFLSHPNDAHDRDAILKLIEWMEPQFEKRGFSTRRIETAGAPQLFAERHVADATRTALIYLQADGQPVDATKWDQPSPWRAVLKERNDDGAWSIIDWPEQGDAIDPDWRIFARSASDSKGPMTQFLRAIDAIDQGEGEPAFNLKVIIDTEEELGSPHLEDAVVANSELLEADFLLIFDGPPHASNKPTVTFGARGITTLTLTTYGPNAPQHSGHYGNFVPNPALALARLLASMKDDAGRVRIKGFNDGVKLTRSVRETLANVPDDEEAILAGMGLSAADKTAASLQEAIQYPSLNIRGLASGWVGDEARTIIPSMATAEIDIRTVKESDPARLVELVRRHIEEQGFEVIDHAPIGEEAHRRERIVTLTHEISYGAFRSDFEAEPGKIARAALRRRYGEEPILIRSAGGSIPIAPLVDTLGIPAAIVPSVNIDNNQHSPNENIRLGDFLEGVERLKAVLTEPPEPAE